VIRPAITIVLASKDTPDVDQILKRLAGDERFEVVATVSQIGDLLAVALDLQPRIVLMPKCIKEGEVLRLRGAVPDVRIVLLTEPDGERILAGMRSGVSAFVDKARVHEDLIGALLQSASGQSYLSHSLREFLLRDMLAATPSKSSALSQHQRQIVDLVSRGKTSAEIAYELGISLRTVESYTDQKEMRFLPGFFSKLKLQ
jgi:DNA-binding NarL/FixJ family response regulator